MDTNLSEISRQNKTIVWNSSKDLKDTNISMSPDMMFSDENLFNIIAYSILFVIASTGNLTVFLTLFRHRHKPSKVNIFILNLCIADLIVTLIMMPLEIGWNVTVSWETGDLACRILMFFRALGFYLSSFIIIAISVDRYIVISRPLNLTDGERRARTMLVAAWILSIISSIPQSVIFHEEQHPFFPSYHQCVTFNFFPTPMHELAYNIFNLIAVYVLPLCVIIISYSLILFEISKNSGDTLHLSSEGSMTRSYMGRITRAKSRTLKMTVVIVALYFCTVSVFIVCWTPYFVMSSWWWFHKESAQRIDSRVQKGLFLFAVSNSCVNPIVYGIFTRQFRVEFRRCCCLLKGTSANERNALHRPPVNSKSLHSEEYEMPLFNQRAQNYTRQPTRSTSITSSIRVKLLKRMDSSITLSDGPPLSPVNL